MAEPKHASPPSSGTSGFFQESPVLQPAFEEDITLQRIYKFYLPNTLQKSFSSDFHRFSNLVQTRQVLNWCADAERNTPHIRSFDAWGRRIDELVTTEGWRKLQDLGIQEGIVAIGHEGGYGQYGRVYQFLKYQIWTPSCAIVTCPSAMTDGAARLLHTQLKKKDLNEIERKVFQSAYDHLMSRDISKAWTSGQWMTERPGGSDVQDTETQGTYSPDTGPKIRATDVDGNPLGSYSISGFKWFSSATDANSTVLLAREPSGAISAFFAPTRRLAGFSPESELNGIAIQKLKSKLGTRALPTAELVLDGMRAWRIGKSGQGTKEISTVLNITRVHNAVSAVGFWGRGLAISRAFSKVRKARGKLLIDLPAHVRTMAEQHVEYRAMMHLAFYTVALLGRAENGEASHETSSHCEAASLTPQAAVPHLLRLVTPLAKMLTAKAAIAGLQECMESLGGVGYLENEDISVNIARLYRDSNVLSIWEGTTNIMADDLVRIVKGSSGAAVLDALDSVVKAVLLHWKEHDRRDWVQSLSTVWRQLRVAIEKRSREDLSMSGRILGRDLGWVVCAILLGADALSDGDAVSDEICSRWIFQGGGKSDLSSRSFVEKARWDRLIVFGETGQAGGVAKL